MTVYTGSDHAGLDLKLKMMAAFPELEWKDMGTFTSDSVDYPDYANKVCEALVEVEHQNTKNNVVDPLEGPAMGLLICGSGQGMAIRANRFKEVRAALCWNEEIAALSREHNNANILCLSARFTSPDLAIKMFKTFMATKFAGGRHLNRVQKLGL